VSPPEATRRDRFPEASALRAVFAELRYIVAYVVLLVVVGLGYALLLQTVLMSWSTVLLIVALVVCFLVR